MNKRTKTSKLPLHHEILRVLDHQQLSLVAAGDARPSLLISHCVQCVKQ
jgi:hypothetical protein